MNFAPFQLVSGPVALTANYTSSAMDMKNVWVYSLQALYSGIVAGEFKIQVSNDLVPQFTDVDAPYFFPRNWSDLSGTVSSTVQVAGSNTYFTNQVSPGYRWARVVFTANSAVGTLAAINVLTKSY